MANACWNAGFNIYGRKVIIHIPASSNWKVSQVVPDHAIYFSQSMHVSAQLQRGVMCRFRAMAHTMADVQQIGKSLFQPSSA